MCQRSGDLKKLFLEAKVIELLMLQLEQINSDGFQAIALKRFRENSGSSEGLRIRSATKSRSFYGGL